MDKQAESQRDRVRRLNDQFRRSGFGRGSLMLTSGVNDLGFRFVSAAVAAVQGFDAFDRNLRQYGRQTRLDQRAGEQIVGFEPRVSHRRSSRGP